MSSKEICPYCHECKIAEIMSKKLNIERGSFAKIENYDPFLCPRVPEGTPSWLPLNAPPTTNREIKLVAMKQLSNLLPLTEEI